MMKTSIITPTFNRANHLRECLCNVSKQTAPPLEHLIIDNLSTDETPQIVNDYSHQSRHPVRYVREKDSGSHDAINKGLALATGEAVYILSDDDCFATEETLALFGACLRQTCSDIVFGDVIVCDPVSESTQLRRHNQVNKLTLIHKTINLQAILFRRSVFETVGRFDESLMLVGDYEWLLRAFLGHNISATYLRAPVARFRLGGMSNNPAFSRQFSDERMSVRQQWFSEKDVRGAKIYRKYVRKIPFGTLLMNWFLPLKLRVRTVRYVNGRFQPDFSALLGF